jgi:hypothetical protein
LLATPGKSIARAGLPAVHAFLIGPDGRAFRSTEPSNRWRCAGQFQPGINDRYQDISWRYWAYDDKRVRARHSTKTPACRLRQKAFLRALPKPRL